MSALSLAIAAERSRLYRYARSLTSSRDDAEDLVQDTMLQALRFEHQFKNGTNLAAWLNTIMRNCRFDSRRIRRANTILEDADGHHTLLLPGAEDQGAAYEAMDGLKRIANLPVSHSRAMMMMAEGMSVHEVAEREGVPDGTIKSRVSRGRTMLAELIGGAP